MGRDDWKKSREIAREIARARVNRYALFISEQAQRVTILHESTPAQRTVTPPRRQMPGQDWNPNMRQPVGRVPSGALGTVDNNRPRSNPQPDLRDGRTRVDANRSSSFPDGWDPHQKPEVTVPQYSATDLNNQAYSTFARACAEVGAKCLYSGYGVGEPEGFTALVKIPLQSTRGPHSDSMTELLASAENEMRKNPYLGAMRLRVLSQVLTGDHVELLVQTATV